VAGSFERTVTVLAIVLQNRLPATTGSIGRKLTRLVLTTTFAALLVAAVALVIYEAKTYREMWVPDLTTQAEILARSSAPALAFEDPKSAAATLQTLQAREPVEVVLAQPGLEATYDVVLYSEFEDKAALDAYVKHPVHQAVVPFIGAIREARQCMDYEV